MHPQRLFPLVLACLSTCAIAAPRFEDFPAPRYTGQTANVRLMDKQSRQYARILRTESHRPINFAGGYVLATWGCGASCVMGAAIDAKTGSVTWLPFTVCCRDLRIVEPLEFHLDSRLLVVHGNINETGAATDVHYYGFDGQRFAPIISHP